ncbi:electron transport complex subunit RsxC [Flexistipes sp.]|uniref:electron transport complex subunit RsxC n=1 Tax=Flexistipes sp. TaxID=3088135 RepID=UPI002E1B25D0|nr:electron transport complex subunit RsxC [Flexistipes sp.]
MTNGFIGGIHPDYKKTLTADKPIEKLSYEKDEIVSVPLSQHIGAPAQELVKKKEQVLCGQKIGASKGFISTNIHSSVTGEVVSIGNLNSPLTGKVKGINIKISNPEDSPKQIDTGKKFQDLILEAGIVGMGGATFPTHVKLSPPKKIDTLIINGAECEPFLTCDYRLMIESTEEIIKGAKIIQDELKIEKLIIAVEDNKPEAIKAFNKYIHGFNFEVKALPTVYPQGGEKQLILSVLGRIVPEGKLPLEVGVIVHNVATCKALYDAVENGLPLTERAVTVTGAVKEPKNLLVKIGTPVSKLIDACGGYVGEPEKIVIGGPMMGFSANTTDMPVSKATSGVIVFRKEDLPSLKMTNCIRCGRCVSACPMGLVPAIMEQFAISELYERLLDWHVLNCIECGCCSYVCPARRPLVGYFKTGKRQVMNIVKERENK